MSLSSSPPPRRSELEVRPEGRSDAPASDATLATPGAASFERAVGAPRAALRRSGHGWRLAARAIGLACFLLGVALLLWTFLQAARGLQAFTKPDYLSQKFNRVAGDSYQAQLAAGIIVIGAEFLRAFYLLLMGAFASLLAARGAQFFAASDAVMDEALAEE